MLVERPSSPFGKRAAKLLVFLGRLHNTDVSENSGTPKSSISIGVSIINHPFWGTPIFGNTHAYASGFFCLQVTCGKSFCKKFSVKLLKVGSSGPALKAVVGSGQAVFFGV